MTQRKCHSSRPLRRGLTLIEILIALTMTLIVLGAMMEAFRYANEKISEGRAVIEMASQLRITEDVLRSDLENCTVAVRPHSDVTPPGFLEYIEGARRDDSGATDVNFNYLGDVDDILMLTVAAGDEPFRGRGLSGEVIESPLAMVVWWTSWVDRDDDNQVDFDESTRLYRRVLLIRPDLNLAGRTVPEFYQTTDIAAYVNTSGTLVACSLQDLARRERRPYHLAAFPHQVDRFALAESRQADLIGGAPVQTGEDIILTNVAAFDIRAYALRGLVKVDSNIQLDQGDGGFASSTAVSRQAGTFVDLNVNNIAPVATADPMDISGPPAMPNGSSAANALRYLYSNTGLTVAQRTALGFTNVYDTWSPHYEFGGAAKNGLDDDNANGVDDPGERVRRPPYAAPLRGLEVTIRMVEDNTKQVRQSSVVQSFVPE